MKLSTAQRDALYRVQRYGTLMDGSDYGYSTVKKLADAGLIVLTVGAPGPGRVRWHATRPRVSEFPSGGVVPASSEVFTAEVWFEAEETIEEIDVIVRRGTPFAEIEKFVYTVLDRDYLPGGRVSNIAPFRGVAISHA